MVSNRGVQNRKLPGFNGETLHGIMAKHWEGFSFPVIESIMRKIMNAKIQEHQEN